MMAEVRLGNNYADSFPVSNGLTQGCTCFMLEIQIPTDWSVGEVQNGKKLVGDHTAKVLLHEVKVTESQFVHDIAV